MKMSVILLSVILGFVLVEDNSLASDNYIAYVHRWTVTEVASGAVVPPLKLLWEKSPILFERANAGGLSESPSRRIAEIKDGLVTVMKRKLYMLDKKNGSSIWSLSLQGDEIFDWKLAKDFFLYSSVDYQKKEIIRGGVDLAARKEIWLHKEPVSRLFQPERLIPTQEGVIVYVSNGDDKGINDAVVAINIKTGKLRWKSSTDVEQRTLVPFTWFVHGEQLHTLIAPKRGGLFLKSFNLIDGKNLSINRLFGNYYLGNIFHPTAIGSDSTLLIGYNKLPRPQTFLLIAYSLTTDKLIWSTGVSTPNDQALVAFKHIVSSPSAGDPIVATVKPNRFVVFNSNNGVILKDGTLPGYVGWTEPNAILYSYPYLFTSARRALEGGMAYDLITINIETGRIDWSYEIDKDNRNFSTANAEILNFLVSADAVYLSRADGRVMAFRRDRPSRATGK